MLSILEFHFYIFQVGFSGPKCTNQINFLPTFRCAKCEFYSSNDNRCIDCFCMGIPVDSEGTPVQCQSANLPRNHFIFCPFFFRSASLVLNAPIKLIFYPLLVVQRVNFIRQMTIDASIVFVWEYLRIVRELQSNVNLQICPEVWKKWISMKKPWDFHSPTRISQKKSVNCRSILGVESFTTTKYRTLNQM